MLGDPYVVCSILPVQRSKLRAYRFLLADYGLATFHKVDDLLREEIRPFAVDGVAGARQKHRPAGGHFHAWRNISCLLTEFCADILYPTHQQHTLRISRIQW